MKTRNTALRLLSIFWSPQLLALLFAVVLCAFFVRLAGQNPMVAGKALVDGAAGSSLHRAESLSQMIPLIMTGLSVAIAFRAGFFNVGAEGQFIMGALASVALANKCGCPIEITLLGGALAGAAWALIAGVMKTRRGAPEIITTIMLNYVALQLAGYCVGINGPLQEAGGGEPITDTLPAGAQLPALVADTNLHVGLFIALFCVALCWWLLFRTERGFLWRAAGANPIASRAMGIDIEKNVLGAVALCGALSGLGGAMEIAGATKFLEATPNFGYGYTAIAVALLADLNPLGVVPAALLFGMLNAGGGAMERAAGVPSVTVSIVIGVVIFVIAGAQRLKHRN